MTKLVWDIETDGLNPTVVHCVAVYNVGTGELRGFGPDAISDAIDLLNTADVLISHNGIGYDHPVMSKLLGWRPNRTVQVRDTLVWSRYTFPNLLELDMNSPRQDVRSLGGSGALRSWGIRLECHKGDFEGPWETFTPEMMEYCKQDTVVAGKLYLHLEKHHYSEDALNLEHRIAYEYDQMERRGFLLDTARGLRLKEQLESDLSRLEAEINRLIPPRVEEKKTPEYWTVTWPDGTSENLPTKTEIEVHRKRRGVKPKQISTTKGPNKVEYHPFNPGSGKQIRDYFVNKYNWSSPKLTDSGNELLRKNPQADYDELARDYGSTEEDVLRTLTFPEARLFADHSMVSKVYSMVYSGDSAWLKDLPADSRLRYRLLHIGCVTHRTSATRMIQQTPAVVLDKDKHPIFGFDGRYGADCRAMFIAQPGYVLFGWDLSGIECVVMAHFLAAYDGGAYVHQVLHGDIHQQNVTAIEQLAGYSVARKDTKPMFYGVLYGIGYEKQGRVVVESCDDALQEFQDLLNSYTRNPGRISRFTYAGRSRIKMRAASCAFADIGEKVNKALVQGIDGLEDLIRDVQERAKERKYLTGLDGRRLPIRKPSAALNTLLQGNAGIIFKRAVVNASNAVMQHGLDVRPLMVCHDEQQAEVLPAHVERYRALVTTAIADAGKRYDLKIAVTGSCAVGANWCETH